MTGEAAATAVAKFRTDLPDVTPRDVGAAQGAMGVRAQRAVIDKNEAEHDGPPPGIGFLVKTRLDLITALLLIEIRLDDQLFPDRHLVIAPHVLLIQETHEAHDAWSSRPTRNPTL
jgi:hypothetical protein